MKNLLLIGLIVVVGCAIISYVAQKKPKKPLKWFYTVLLASISIWLWLLINKYLILNDPTFMWGLTFLLMDVDYNKLNLVLFYAIYFGMMAPWAIWAGVTIAQLSNFRRPYLVSFLVSFGNWVIMFGVGFFLRSLPSRHPAVLIFAGFTEAFLLACVSLVGVWLVIGPTGRFLRKIGRTRIRIRSKPQ